MDPRSPAGTLLAEPVHLRTCWAMRGAPRAAAGGPLELLGCFLARLHRRVWDLAWCSSAIGRSGWRPIRGVTGRWSTPSSNVGCRWGA